MIGTLVIADLPKYLDKSNESSSTADQSDRNLADESLKTISYDFNRVRRSVVDAYEGTMFCDFHSLISVDFSAALSQNSKRLAKQKLKVFESTAGHSRNESDKELIKEDALANVRQTCLFFFKDLSFFVLD